MKTTIDIADGLMAAARERARIEGTTLRALVERGLQAVLSEPAGEDRRGFEPVTAELEPLPGVDPGDWDRIRDLIYEPPGGPGERR